MALLISEPSEEVGCAMLERATSLEAKGQVRQAVLAYEAAVKEHPGTTAAQDAKKSLDDLRARLG